VNAQSDGFSITSKSFLLPQPQSKGKFTQALSIYYVVPPRIWTLDMVNAPMFNYSAKYSLGKGFNLQGGLSSLIISNRFNFGPFWTHQVIKFLITVVSLMVAVLPPVLNKDCINRKPCHWV
jgi:hypothetical protein